MIQFKGGSIVRKLTHRCTRDYMYNLQSHKEETLYKIEQTASIPEHNDIHDFFKKRLELLQFIEKQCFLLTGEMYEVAKLMLDNVSYKVSVETYWKRYEKGESSFNRRKKDVLEIVTSQVNRFLDFE